jgi:hypothetical protein
VIADFHLDGVTTILVDPATELAAKSGFIIGCEAAASISSYSIARAAEQG